MFKMNKRPVITGKIFQSCKANLKKLFVSYHSHPPKYVTWAAGKTFFILFKLNVTFYFKCYIHHNCRVNVN